MTKEEQNKEIIEREIRERLDWARGKVLGSKAASAHINTLNKSFAPMLKRKLDGSMDEMQMAKIRNLLGVYKYTILELVK